MHLTIHQMKHDYIYVVFLYLQFHCLCPSFHFNYLHAPNQVVSQLHGNSFFLKCKFKKKMLPQEKCVLGRGGGGWPPGPPMLRACHVFFSAGTFLPIFCCIFSINVNWSVHKKKNHIIYWNNAYTLYTYMNHGHYNLKFIHNIGDKSLRYASKETKKKTH